MASDPNRLTATSHALLGQLALRPWSIYEMTKNVGRTLHWFWPRAESVIYAETKRLADLGLAKAKSIKGKRGRPRTVYSITPKGRRALGEWLGSESDGFSLQFESLLRVHLSPYGTKDDLLRALESARDDAEQLLQQATEIGREFIEERHQFQEQVHIRAILFDYLWHFGLGMHEWAERSIDKVNAWNSLDTSRRSAKEGIDLIRSCLEDAPS